MKAVIISGAPGSGKSTVGNALANALPRGAHIQVDFFRKMVKGGYASPHHWNDEVTLQYRLARTSAALTARTFSGAGIVPILDDIVPPDWAEDWVSELEGIEILWVLIRPPLEVALLRNREREIWTVDEKLLKELFDMFGREYPIEWLVIDNSEITASEAAEQVISRLAQR